MVFGVGSKSVFSRTSPTIDSTVDFVVNHLRQGIINGSYESDTKLLPRQIAEHCGTSFIPVREALRILEAEGFVIFRHNRGAWVTMLSVSDLEDLYTLRIELEAEAVRRARPFEERSIDQLRNILVRMNDGYKRGDTQSVVALNHDLHFHIYRRCGSPRRLRVIEQLWFHAERYQQLAVAFRHDAADLEHREIIDALADGDHHEAADALTKHLTTTVDLLRIGWQNVEHG